jgi:hypothetical protein
VTTINPLAAREPLFDDVPPVHVLEQIDDLLGRTRGENCRLDAGSPETPYSRARDPLDFRAIGNAERRLELPPTTRAESPMEKSPAG